jgi:hypothetical protein
MFECTRAAAAAPVRHNNKPNIPQQRILFPKKHKCKPVNTCKTGTILLKRNDITPALSYDDNENDMRCKGTYGRRSRGCQRERRSARWVALRSWRRDVRQHTTATPTRTAAEVAVARSGGSENSTKNITLNNVTQKIPTPSL